MFDADVRLPDRDDPLPLWAQVLGDVRRRLDDGEFAAGFPPERELIEQYGVSRHTVRDAMRRLQNAGVINRERGKGTFLRTPSLEQPTGALYSLFKIVEAQGYEQRSKVLELSLVTDEGASARLQLPASAELVYLQRVRYADDTPIALDEIWLPADIAAPLLNVDFAHTALYIELEARCATRPGAGWERVQPILVSPHTRSLLGMAARQPAFLIERYTETQTRALEWRRTIVRGDRYSLVTRWDRTGRNTEPPMFEGPEPTTPR